MRAIDVEVKVLAAVDAIRRGQRIEDDLIECKRDWPESGKARQLAGSCNRARGHPVILIIGVDEKTGTVMPLSSSDPSSWWPSISARFDEVAPDLETHIVVPLGNEEEVVALQFGTERVPYVVKNAAGQSPHREIPIRDGTTTRSAYRHEIIRMLGPTVNLPTATLLSTEILLSRSPSTTGEPDQGMSVSGRVQIYIEHLAPDFTMIPAHRIEAHLEVEDVVVPVGVQTAQFGFPAFVRTGETAPRPPSERRFGVAPRDDGLLITASGSANLFLAATSDSVTLDKISAATSCELAIALYVDGSDVPLRIRVNANRDETDSYHAKQRNLLFRA